MPTHRQLERRWAADPFLKAGGGEGRSNRPPQGFRRHFANLHAAGVPTRAGGLKQSGTQLSAGTGDDAGKTAFSALVRSAQPQVDEKQDHGASAAICDVRPALWTIHHLHGNARRRWKEKSSKVV